MASSVVSRKSGSYTPKQLTSKTSPVKYERGFSTCLSIGSLSKDTADRYLAQRMSASVDPDYRHICNPIV
jgi:biotin synthase-like enzyme